MKRKMTEEELSTLMVYKVTVITTDKMVKKQYGEQHQMLTIPI